MIFNTNEGPGMRRPTEVIPPMPISGPSVGASPTPAYYQTDRLGRMQRVTPPAQAAYYQQRPMMQQNVVVNQKRGVNHGLHLVLTLVTFGMWSPIWILDALFNS